MHFQTTSKPVRQLVLDFNKGAILLPQFQRDYVWKSAKIRNLLDSLLKGFPIGGLYLWRPTGNLDPKSKAFGKSYSAAPMFEGYLIDGQQRLTSLEAAFGLYAGEDKRGDELRCYLDLAAPDIEQALVTRIFVTYSGNKSVARRVEVGDSTLIPLSQLFDGQNYELRQKTEESLRLLKGWNAKRVDKALARFDQACKMLDQQIPSTTILDVKDKEAVEVFSRLNKGGTALRQGDVRAAELARGHTVNVLKNMRKFVAGELPQRLGFGFSFAFRALVLFHRQSAQFSTLKPDWMDVPGPFGRSLAQSWEAAERAINKALDFVDHQMGWSRKALLPSANAVIVLASALDKANLKVDMEDRQLYCRWLSLTALRGVFQGSVETTINRFHKAIKESKKETAQALLQALKRDEARRVRPDEFNRYAQMWGPATQVIHAWLVSQEARDWLIPESTPESASESTIDMLARVGDTNLPGGDLTVHHIFPRRVLANIVESADEANCPANYALLSRSTNAKFGDDFPSDVFATLKPDERKLAAVQFFGEAAGDRLEVDHYEEFCQWRAEQLAESINDWLGIVPARKIHK
jgi:hypothetical protein